MTTKHHQRLEEERRLNAILQREEEANKTEYCALCTRPLLLLATERDIPATFHRMLSDTRICRQCCQQLHHQMKSRDRFLHFQTPQDIREDEVFQTYLRWVKKLSPETLYT